MKRTIESRLTALKSCLRSALLLGLLIITTNSAHAQCVGIAGNVESENDASGIANVLVKAFNSSGELVQQEMTDFFGNYELDALTDGQPYRVEFVYGGGFRSAEHSSENGTSVQFVNSPSCDVDFSLVNPDDFCAENAKIALTCFVQGGEGENDDLETLVFTDYGFNLDSSPQKYANKNQTGSVWGLTWKSSTQELFSSAFIKQYATLTEHGHGAIFTTNTNTKVTELHARLDELGENIGTILTDPYDPDYGAQVGKFGLGGLEISEDEETLYVVNLHNNTLVSLSTTNPTAETTESFKIPNPGCLGGDTYRAFALTRSGSTLYVGVTCTAIKFRENSELSATVYTFDLETEEFQEIFTTDYPKGYWLDTPSNSLETQHWLTDLAITDEGNMVLSLSDRIAHRYHNVATNGRLDDQHPDILLAYNDDGEWKLENNAMAGVLTGSHPSQANGEGPGGGEFFGYDYWISGPVYHSEIATGSVMVLPGDGSVVATVYDPDFDSYTGGLHKYSTTNGEKLGVGIVYEHSNDPLFGKASGLGDMVTICGDLPLEIGNLLWVDSNNDGVQDAGEPFLPNIDLKLYNADCEEVGSTSTDENGNYYFNNGNVDLNQDGTPDGLAPGSQYYVVITDDAYDTETGTLSQDGVVMTLTKEGIGFGTHADMNDSDAELSAQLCEVVNGRPTIAVRTGETGNSDHTFDIGFSPAGGFDLALKKELVGDFAVKYGEEVTFKITIINQGGVTADEILVNDYIAAGYEFDADADVNDGWKMDEGVAQTLVGTPIIPGASHELFITLTVKEGASAADLVNVAEIGGAYDEEGVLLEDEDSTPDRNPDNDNGGEVFQATDNEVNDDGMVDEDDHDPAAVGIFDLALRKVLTNPGAQVFPNSQVDFTITVFNQGSITASQVVVSDYLPEELIFIPDANDGWELQNDSTITYVVEGEIAPLGMEVISLTLEVGNVLTDIDIVNVAEISTAVDEYGNTDSDVDSKADGDRGNDTGGSPYNATDNEIQDNGDVDEDDHDPALLNLQLFDLALVKTTLSSSVKAGEQVDFKIMVLNQGEVAAKMIGIVDYIPVGLTLDDEDWEMDGQRMAKKDVLVAGGLQPGDSTSVDITLRVDDDFIAGTLVNLAEIDHVSGMDNRDLSFSDVDSRPDDQRGNDAGGLPFGPTDNELDGVGLIDEDDHDPAFVYVFAALVDEACICLENASNTEEGQFGELIQIIAPSGLDWYIEDADGLFDASANVSNMGVPTGDDYIKGVQYPMTEFTTGVGGYMLEEYVIGTSGNSEYYIVGMRQDGEDYRVVVRNNIGDQEIISGGACNYETNTFSAAEGVCTGDLVTYCVDDFSTGVSNEWIVTGDAVIVGANDGECVNVQYGTSVGSEVDIVFTSNDDDACYSPAMRTVTIGESAGTLSCLGNVNVSLNSDCELDLTPGALLTTPVNVASVYSIIYTTAEGFMLGDNVDWVNYEGREVVAKVMDNCSGNSCWSFVKVEDKTAPEIECFDLTVSCIEMMNYNGPFVLDNCSGEATLIPTGQTQEALDCDPDFSFRLVRSFKARDDFGNMSAECVQTISVERPDLTSVVAPPDRTMDNNNALSCDILDMIEDGGELDPLIYGVPTLEGEPIFPSSGSFCNLGVTYKDQIFPSTGCVTKIMRQWFIFEWHCENATPDTLIQFFNIADMEDPSITCMGDMNVSTNGSSCLGNVTLPAAVVSDDCTENPRVDITYPGGFLENSNGGIIELPIGTHEVTYTVTDDCFNSSSCTIMVTIEDRTPPIAVCEQHTVLSVRTDGTTYAFASTFDDGSFDDCAFGGVEVRRMDGGEACGMDDEGLFSDRVEFCCADVGEEVMVVLRVFDAAMNANQCMVSVQIQDKNPPTVVAPADITIDCEQAIELTDLSPFGVATATDNCNDPVITEEVISRLNECRTGEIVRIFRATDGNGEDFDTQTITVITEDTFRLENIIWPINYTTSAQCDAGSLLPENLPLINGFPRFLDEGFCSQVAWTYSDKVFDILNSETLCQKIIRTWIVEDFCQPLGEGEFASWRFDQVIEISNNVAPELTSSCDDITIETFNENCMTGAVTLTAGATDDCTPGDMMRYSYFVDLNNNDTIDLEDSGAGDTLTINAEFPLGSHSVLYRFRDVCGNVVSCRQNFTVVNAIKPTIVCHDGLSVALTAMDTDGDGVVDDEMAIVKARTFNASSFHPCEDSLIYSFTENPADSCRTYDCDSIGMRSVTIYGITPSGAIGFCTTTLDVQDNNDVDLCRSVEDCIVMPVDITITECTDDFSPETIGGGPTIDPECICTMTTVEFTDRDSTDVDNTCTTIVRDWTVTFNCGDPMVFTTSQVITIFDSRPPILSCPDGVTVNSNADDCNASVVVGIPEVLSDCTTEFTITNDSEFDDGTSGAATGIYPVGSTDVVYTVTDKCGNASQCDITILVTDNANPNCDVVDLTINVTDTITDITVDPLQIDNGSSDECGMVVERVLSPNTFGCDEAGSVVDVILTITDDSGNSTDCMAQITVRDSVPPVCRTRTTNVNLFDDAMVMVPASVINNGSFDLCGEIDDVEIFNNQFNCERLGLQTVTLRITDESGNSTDCEQEVNVFDRGMPTCILQDITVQLDGNDQASISGDDLDDGSFDICSGLDTLILDRTQFDCDDLGSIVIVNVMAVDSAGNAEDCSASVTVETEGVLMCIADSITVFLDVNGEVTITAEDVDGGSGVPCGEDAMKTIDRSTFFCNDAGIQNTVTLTIMSSAGDTSCMATVMVMDTLPPVLGCPADMTVSCVDISEDLSVYGSLTSTGGNCPVLSETIMDTAVFNLNACGLGTIMRTFTAEDINGNEGTCTQMIVVESGTSFTEANIMWPTDTLTIAQCISIDPDTIGSRPTVVVPDSMCTNLGITFTDEALTANENCQDTVRRTWMVIDSCPDPNNIFTYEQVLILSDEMAPMITIDDTLFVCDTIVNYEFLVADCNEVTVTYTSDTTVSGMGTMISGDFPNGLTTVRVTATDRCGNEAMDSIVVNVELDTVPPSITCINRTIIIEDDGETVVLPSDGEWFFAVSDNTTDSSALMYSFNPEFDMSTDTLRFVCDSVIIKSHFLDIFVKDKNNTVATCRVSYVTTDPNDVCPDAPAAIQGIVTTEASLEIPDVKMDLVNGDVSEMTDQQGFYAFDAMESETVYELRPEKNTEHMDGVTTLDLVLIQRHILGTTKLTSAYQVIAADINNSGNVSGVDLLVLRKNILGLLDGFTNNESWRFVDADYTFVDATHPFNEVFPESYMIYDMNGPVYKNFIGMKVGDVNGSILLNGERNAVVRSAPLVVSANDRVLAPGSIVSVPVSVDEAIEVAGTQVSFVIASGVDVLNISSDFMEVNDAMYSVRQEGQDQILTIVLTPESDKEVNAGEALFELVLSTDRELLLSDGIAVNASFKNELYTVDLEVREVGLEIVEDSAEELSEVLLQNTPNPWKDKTVIGFKLPTAQQAVINVYSMTGSLITSVKGDYEAGMNSVEMKAGLFNNSGVYYYELVTDTERISKRMILVK